MTADEFKTWLRHHVACFPSIETWLAKMDSVAGKSAVGRDDILRQWREVLKDVDLQRAREASTAMLRGDIEEPAAFGSHVKAIRQHARKARTEATRKHYTVGHEETYRCAMCRDSGLITVIHDQCIRAAREGKLQHQTHNPSGRTSITEMAVACTCHAGSEKAYRLKLDTFNSRKHVPASVERDAWQNVQAFVSDPAHSPMAAYTDEEFSI